MEVRKIELKREEQTKCLSVLEGDNGVFFLYVMRKKKQNKDKKETGEGECIDGQEESDEEEEEEEDVERQVSFCENPIFVKPKALYLH